MMPEWWPTNPYPEDIFTMKRERYAEIVPDPNVRTALSGCLGREFWDIASRSIWEAVEEQLALKDERIKILEAELEEVRRNGKLMEGWFAIEKKKRVEFEKGLTLWRAACHRYQDRQEALVVELAEMATKRAEAEADAMGAVSDLCKLTALVLRGRDEGSVAQDDIRKALEAVLTLRSNLVFAEMNADSFKALAGEVQVENEKLAAEIKMLKGNRYTVTKTAHKMLVWYLQHYAIHRTE